MAGTTVGMSVSPGVSAGMSVPVADPIAPITPAKTNTPGGGAAPAVQGPTAYTQLSDYLKSVGAPNDMPSIQALGAKAGISDYIYSEDQNKKLLGILQAGQGGGTSNSVNSGTSAASGKALGGAITSAVGTNADGTSTKDTSGPVPHTPTGSGTVTTSGFVDPTTGAFDSNAYSTSALADAQTQVTNVKSENNNSYQQGQKDLQVQMDQWTQTWQQQKDFAVNDARQYNAAYADQVGAHYDQIYAQQQGTFANAKSQLNTNFSNANLSADNQFATDKQGIATNVANFGMSQQQFAQTQLQQQRNFDLTQSQDLYKNFTTYATTFAATAPTPETTKALTDAGITPGMDMSKLTLDQYQTAKNLSPDFFSMAEKAGLSPAEAASSYLGGTFKGQAAALAQDKYQLAVLAQQDKMAIAQISASNAQERLSISQDRLVLAQGNAAVNRAKGMYTQFKATNTPGAGLLTAATYMSQIEAGYSNKGKGVAALSMLDALVKIDTGGQAIRQGQLDIIEKSGSYGNAISRIMTNIGAGVDDNGNLTGSNIALSPAQVEQIYAQAKKISAEKIASGKSSFDAFAAGLDSVANNPNVDPSQVYAAAPGYDATKTFIATYGDSKASTAGTVSMTGPMGTYNVPADQVETMKANGYK
jgi:hypothetical protein